MLDYVHQHIKHSAATPQEGEVNMKKHTYRTEKARRDADRLEAMKEIGNETLTDIADIILKKYQIL